MRIWIITVGEPVPSDPGRNRLWRSGYTAKLMAERGHDVVWWNSTMDHFRKVQRFDESRDVTTDDGYRLVFLHGCRYGRNIGLARIRNHRQIAAEFARLAAGEPEPDIILCSLPTLELSREAVRYGARRRRPVVIDVRDQWPDFMLEQLPRWLRPAARPFLGPMFADLREACGGATALISNTPRFIDWGAARAGRSPGPADRYFPHGYPRSDIGREELDAAGARWDDLGVRTDDGVANICFLGTIRNTVLDFESVVTAARGLSGRVRFVICGLGDDRPALMRQAADLDAMILPGWIDEPALQSLMHRSVAGLAPYLPTDTFTESLPNKPAEYMSAGLPILSSLEGFTRQLLTEHDCGYFYRAGDAESLLTAIDTLLDDPDLRRRRSSAARALFVERFSAEKVYGDLADYLEELAAGTRPVA